ncbi:MAG: tripartite tricarboxylate transporter substrate binding protein [Betaproteobacteria bacterium]|nr:tripartite tricarboxylate transporter substrate binding protein [Betaproteobacteria bacterium]
MAKRREFISISAALMASSVLPLPAAAQTYPARPIKYICPWPAGGSTDVVMRSLAEAAGRHLGQAIIVENRPGAGGTLGALDLVNAKPDGYTVAQLPHGVFRLPHMQKVAFDTLKDFTWIACLTGYTFGLVVQAESPFKTIKDLVDYARLNPGKLSYGSTGVGTSPHLAVEEFAQRADIKLNHIPFKGNAENMQALMGGHIASASDATGWGPHVESGKLRLLATYGSKRTKRWPQTPTLDELGYQTVSDSPFGVCGPKGMEPAVTRAIHDAFRKAIAEPSVLAIFDKYDQSVIYMNTEQYTKFARESFAAERATIERLGMLNKDG